MLPVPSTLKDADEDEFAKDGRGITPDFLYSDALVSTSDGHARDVKTEILHKRFVRFYARCRQISTGVLVPPRRERNGYAILLCCCIVVIFWQECMCPLICWTRERTRVFVA